MIGIYKIINTINNKIYIGQSRKLEKRFAEHIYLLRRNKHFNIYLQNSYNKYGENVFQYFIIEECEEENLTNRENYRINYYGGLTSKILYNLQGGEDSFHFSVYIRKKISEANKGKHSKENNGMYKKCHSLKSKQLMSQKLKNNIPWNKGNQWNETIRKKISEANKGKVLSVDQKKNISLGHKGLKYKRNQWTDELCQSIREKHLKGVSYYKLGKELGKNAETIRYAIRRYEKENNLKNSST